MGFVSTLELKMIFSQNWEKSLVFDGAMGTMLQKKGLLAGEMPENMNIRDRNAVLDIHRAYINAGADVISTNSFGANKVKTSACGLDSAQITELAVKIAREAADEADRKVFVAADFGPTGKLMPPLGDFSFEEAVDAFKDCVIAAENAGADFIFFETFSDLYECKAAIIAARENTKLPIAVSLTFDENGRTLTGADVETVSTYLSALGVDALGVNCGLGPDAMESIAVELAEKSGLPIIVNANAGLPGLDKEGNTYFDVPPERFFTFAKNLSEKGVFAVGGCCGTSPDYIKSVAEALSETKRKALETKTNFAVCSGVRTYNFGEKTAFIGERLNPTGKPKLKEALKTQNLDYLCNEAVSQQSFGADILDLNVGIPDIDETEVLPKALLAVQKVCDLPLQLDSANPEALERAARVYNGIPIINSVSGKEEILDSVLPIVKKYGGLVVALLLDDVGIPATAKGRLAIAEKIIKRAEETGISRHRILFDALTMTVATDAESGNKTLECVETLSQKGLKTVLGVSNISFGMPNRDSINASFLSAARARGLSSAIINPASDNMRLAMGDDDPRRDFVFSYEDSGDTAIHSEKGEMTLFDAVFLGLSAKAKELTISLSAEKTPMEIIDGMLIPALNALGKGYEEKTIFLPRLLGGAEAAKAAFAILNGLQKSQADDNGGEKMGIIMATVKGDIHDIGKNIVATLLSNYGFEVYDMGKDVAPEDILKLAIEKQAKMVGLSALMTTTVPAMAETVALLKRHIPEIKVMVGGAVMTSEYADQMGADFYGEDAMAAVKFAAEIRGV